MKPPLFPSLSDSVPVPHFGQVRGFEPSARFGKSRGARSSFSASSTAEIRRSLMSLMAAEKSFQKSRSTSL